MKGKAKQSAKETRGQMPTPSTDDTAGHGPYAGKPLDGSLYHEVIEEQIYSELRPSAAEQTPRYAFLNPPPPSGRKRKTT